MEFLKKNKFIILGSIIGAIGGYAYYHFIGCASGTCAITSKPLNSSLMEVSWEAYYLVI